LTVDPNQRQPLDARLWQFYRDGDTVRRELETFVTLPTIRTLLALGEKAQVRYYKTTFGPRRGDRENLQQLFAVTYNDAGKKKTFFVDVRLEHSTPGNAGRAAWRVTGFEGGVDVTGASGRRATPQKGQRRAAGRLGSRPGLAVLPRSADRHVHAQRVGQRGLR
jgi:hypothetical protein